MLKKTVLALIGACSAGSAFALTTGDIAFTSFNADEDGWSIVTFVDIAAGTTIHFSDNEWNGSTFNTGEGQHTWNSGGAVIAAGTVIRFSAVDQATRSVSAGSISSSGDTGINATSETIYAFLGASPSAPSTFLAGVSSEGSTNLAPAGLVGGDTAIIVTNSADYGVYTGARTGMATFGEYRSLVNDAANWSIAVGGDQASMIPDTTSFATAPIPEPSTYAMLGAGLIGLGLSLKRRGSR